MTRRDFELIAEAIATVEADYKGLHQEILSEVTEEIAKAIKRTHPRFNPLLFNRRAMPLKAEQKREATKRALGDSND